MSLPFIIAICTASACCGVLVGWICGFSNGSDQQWCDDYFASVERERARRDRLGRFKAKGAQ